ncbi:MAG: restriction endonuclease subunit S [Prevotella sp.]|nr:restriction endonuclease subunit S [Prevotella sp.]
MRSNYKRLGEFIEEVEERNRDLLVTLSQGICNQKYFQNPRQVAVNSAADKIVRKGWFAYNRATTRNGDKISIAYRDDVDCTVSASYLTFRIKDENKLNPYYLMMWFKRPEFDRYARFKSHGSAHEYFEWDEMCNVLLPVPPIEEQRKIVAEYQAIEQRIENNRRLIATLEATAQTIYRKMFVEDIDPENLPEGWRMGTIDEFCKEIKSGGTPNRSNLKFWDKKQYRWLKSGEVANNVVFDTEEYISEEGLNGSSARIIPSGAVVMAMYGATASQVAYLACPTTTNQACCNMLTNTFEEAAYLYFHCLFRQEEIKRLANGGAQENLSQELICAQPIIICNNADDIYVFAILLQMKIAYAKEICKLDQLLSICLSKLIND